MAENVKQSLKILHSSNVNYELRTTLVKNFHTLENIQKLSQDLNGEKKLFLQKFVDSGNCLQNNLQAVGKEEATTFKNILSTTIDNVELRGY